MTIDEAKQVFLSRGYVEVEGGTIYDANKWRESCHVISEWLEQETETVTEFADRCRECGAKYGKLFDQKTGHWNIPFLIHKELEIPIYEAQKAYEVAIDYLRSQAHVMG